MANTSTPASIKRAMMERIFVLWDHVAALGTADADQAFRRLLEGLCQLLSARMALCMITVLFPRMDTEAGGGDWRPRYVLDLESGAMGRADLNDVAGRFAVGKRDISMVNHLADAGNWRARRLCELVPPEWFTSAYYEHIYTGRGRVDAIWVGCPLRADVEVHVSIIRGTGQPAFGKHDRDTALFAMRGLGWFLQRYVLSMGANLATAPLTDAEREVLRLLLQGHSPRAMAADLSQSVYTTQEHIQAIYRKFNVTRRSELVALWTG